MTAVTDSLASEILEGLRTPPRRLPCKLLYDAEGSRLFERICTLPEYYPTRTEIGILERWRGEIAEALGPGVELVEYGSGSGHKTRLMLEALSEPSGLTLIEISSSALLASLGRLRERFPQVEVRGVEGDYTDAVGLPPARPEAERRVVFFPGSTIGNFTPAEAVGFLRRVRRLVGTGSRLLLGTDMVKDPAILRAAYDDPAGVTAAFNRNILAHVNRLLGGDCDPRRFDHHAPWDPERRRIDMLLVAREDIAFTLGGEHFSLRAGEAIHTEHSHKYRPDDIPAIAEKAGWRLERSWYDDAGWFGVHLLGTD